MLLSINEPRLTPNFLASVLQLDLPLVSVFQPGGGQGVGFLNGRSHIVKMLGRQHAFPKLCVVPDGPCCTPDSRACGGATRTRQAFSFYQQCARALRRIQSSRIVVFVHKLERYNASYVTCLICIPTLAIFGTKLCYFLVVGFLSSCCFCLCYASHMMSSCASHLHTCSSHASEHFLHCPFCIPALLCPPVSLSTSFSCAGVKRFRIGPRLAKRPWFTTGTPHVKFHTIWTSFDTPTVN